MKTIVTHDNCPDGLASAMILRLAFPQAEIRFIQYNSVELAALQPSEDMIFCDFSPPADRAAAFREAGVTVLDHHKTARGIVESFGARGIFADEATEPGVSGAVLAERYIRHLPRYLGPDSLDTVHAFARLAGVRDTWQKDDPEWEAACAQARALMFWPREKWLSASIAEWAGLAEIGLVLVKQHEIACRKAISVARQEVRDGFRVIIFQGTDLTSDIAEIMGKDADLIVGFAYMCDSHAPRGKVTYSLRSHSGWDCARFAKRYGGGGHSAAAGFTMHAITNPYDQFLSVLYTTD